MYEADIEKDHMLPVCFFDRSRCCFQAVNLQNSFQIYFFIIQDGRVYGMMMHTVWDPTRVIDFTPGCGSLAIECIRRRKSVLLVCRSLRHKKTLCKMIKERLAKLTRERTDSRFFRHMPGSVDPSSPVTRDSEVAVVAAEGQANEETSLDGEGHVSSDGNETD